MELSYSTDPDWCSRCRHLPCRCAQAKNSTSTPKTAGKAPIKMRLEKRRGKPLVVLFELGMAPAQQKELLKELQHLCGAGGCLKEGTLELQGDHRPRIEEFLAARGWKVRRAGG